LTAIVWQKSVKSCRTPIFCRRNIFSAWRASTISRYSAGESPPIKVGPPVATAHLATACGGINIFWETWENISEVWEKSAAVNSARPNSKEILLHLRQHFFHARICRREYFVDASILSTRVFCQGENFVNASILSSPTFCQREYFVDTNIFCRRKHFCWCPASQVKRRPSTARLLPAPTQMALCLRLACYDF
jgi:hypothetical protein